MDLSTTYLTFKLPHPLIVGAAPFVDDLDAVKGLVDAGAAAFVMHSLFEEQIRREQEVQAQAEAQEDTFAEALSFFPKPSEFRLGPAQYLDQIQKLKRLAGKIPVIASLNGVTPAGWLSYARQIQQAGADALELNVYYLATDPKESGEAVERRTIEIVRRVKRTVTIPVAVKLSPFYSGLAHFARQLEETGADGLVLFNRFYQPDLDLEKLEVVPTLHLSDSPELLLRLRWVAILSGRVKVSLAVSGGVHTALDALKAVMTGAHAVQLVSVLLKRGPQALKEMRDHMAQWLKDHDYASLKQAQGSLNLEKCPDPSAFERANYMKILAGYRG